MLCQQFCLNFGNAQYNHWVSGKHGFLHILRKICAYQIFSSVLPHALAIPGLYTCRTQKYEQWQTGFENLLIKMFAHYQNNCMKILCLFMEICEDVFEALI